MNRFYSPQQGRFTQVDPIGMGAASLGNPQTLNMYAYCENDPINHVDPDGLLPIVDAYCPPGGHGGYGGRIIVGVVKIAKRVAIGVLSKVRGVSSRQSARTPPFNPDPSPSISLGNILGGLPIGIGVKIDPRTPPFVSGFLHTSSIAIWEAGVRAVGMFLLGAISAAQRRTRQLSAREKALKSGKDAAEAHLNNDDCAKLFGGKANALKVLNSVNIQYADLEKGKYTPKAGGGYGYSLRRRLEPCY